MELAVLLCQKDPIHRHRLDMAKVEHFIDFLLSNSYLQNVASGTTTIEIGNGSAMIVPHVVSTSLKYHLIKIYESHCQSLCYEALSTSSLLRVLEECKFSQTKQITGLDNYTGDGLEGFRILNGLVDKLEVNVDEKKRL